MEGEVKEGKKMRTIVRRPIGEEWATDWDAIKVVGCEIEPIEEEEKQEASNNRGSFTKIGVRFVSVGGIYLGGVLAGGIVTRNAAESGNGWWMTMLKGASQGLVVGFGTPAPGFLFGGPGKLLQWGLNHTFGGPASPPAATN